MNFIMKSIEKKAIKSCEGHPNNIIVVINTISSASVKNCAINISSPVDMFIYQIA